MADARSSRSVRPDSGLKWPTQLLSNRSHHTVTGRYFTPVKTVRYLIALPFMNPPLVGEKSCNDVCISAECARFCAHGVLKLPRGVITYIAIAISRCADVQGGYFVVWLVNFRSKKIELAV